MTRSSCCLVFLWIVIATGAAVAQTSTPLVAKGTPPLGSFGGGPDIINLGNLNAHLTIPVIGRAGRGASFEYDLTYDSSIWYPVTSNGTMSWMPVTNWGWTGTADLGTPATGALTFQTTSIHCDDGTTNPEYSWTYTDKNGTRHKFPRVNTGRGNCSDMPILDAYASDGSGYYLQANGSSGTVTWRSGTLFGSGGLTDNNGNEVTVNGSSVYDTLSSTIPLVTASGTPSSPPVKYGYTSPSSGTAYLTVTYVTHTVQTKFSCSSVPGEYNQPNIPLVDQVQLPDGTAYKFLYEPTPLHTGQTVVTGRVQSITLPTGGTITYNYTGANDGIVCADGSTLGFTRALSPGGTWTYSRTQISGNHWQTKMTTPPDPTVGDDTVIDFQEDSASPYPTWNFFEVQRKVYQGSTSGNNVLLTLQNCYNGFFGSCVSTAVSTPISRVDAYSELPNGSTSAKETTINSNGMVSEIKEYDFGVAIGILPSNTYLRRDTAINYATLGNGLIIDHPSQITVTDGTNTLSQTSYGYGDTVTTTSGTPQHTTPPNGARGNLTSLTTYINGTTTLSKSFSYYDTGNLNVATDVNGKPTTYVYSSATNPYNSSYTASCGNSFSTEIDEPGSLKRFMQWYCGGGVVGQATDESGNSDKTTYTNAEFWRPDSMTDRANNPTSLSYDSQIAVESTMSFSSSVSGFRATVDGLGRPLLGQRQQGPSLNEYDSVQTNYNTLGQVSGTSVPFQSAASTTGSPSTTSVTYDALSRPTSLYDASGTLVETITYPSQDTYIDVVAPSTENHKRRQLESDGLGRLVSVCEITSVSGSGSCGQKATASGFWTKYAYSSTTTGPLLTVTQDVQQGATMGTQTRTYQYDWLGRLTQENNSESGTTNYVYDSSSAPCNGGAAYSSYGDLIMKTNVGTGNCLVYFYDGLHRVTAIGSNNQSSTNPCRRFVYDNNTGYQSSTPPAGLTNTLGRLREAATDSCIGTDTILTNEWFSYDADGRLTDTYESTPNSAGYYHLAKQYWPNGTLKQLSGPPGVPTIYYGKSDGSGLDGEGRVTTVTASSGQSPLVSAVVYNNGSDPNNPVGALTKVTYGSGDSDQFSYSTITGNMTGYQYNVGTSGQAVIAALGWNPNGTLGQFNITQDSFNASNIQNCAYAYDDLTRLSNASCTKNSTTIWGQSFTYDPFGNITKNGSANWVPGYNEANNHYVSAANCQTGGGTPCYDNDGQLLRDGFHSYQWDFSGHAFQIDGTANQITYDALGNLVELNQPGWIGQNLRDVNGQLLGFSQAQSAGLEWVPLPGGGIASYDGGALQNYTHSDWLGTTRLATTPSRTLTQDWARAPFGEEYAMDRVGLNAIDLFTGIGQSVAGDLNETQNRVYHSGQGRWLTPDPAGLAAVDPTNPQTWNRYAYVGNNPLSRTDPLGLFYCACEFDDGGGGGGDPFGPGGGDPCFLYGMDCGGQGPSGPPSLPGGGGGGGVLRQAMQNAATALGNQFCADVVDGGTGIAASTLASNFASMNGTGDPAEIASFGTITSDNLTGSSAFYGHLGVGGLTGNRTEVITGTNPGTAGFLSNITMNSNPLGFFMNPWLVSVMATGTGTGYTNQAFQTIELLHELGHGSAFYGAPSAIVDDSGSATLSGQNTQTIANGCFPQGDFGGNQGPISAPPTAVPAIARPVRIHF